MDGHARIVPMSERIHEMIPLDKIVVLNSRTRDAQQFEEIVLSIAAVGLLQPIKVNRRNLAKTQCYELICGEGRYLACKKLGHSAIYAEVVDYDEERAYIESLVENMARITPGTMAYAQELKRMHDEGVPLDKIAIVGDKAKAIKRLPDGNTARAFVDLDPRLPLLDLKPQQARGAPIFLG